MGGARASTYGVAVKGHAVRLMFDLETAKRRRVELAEEHGSATLVVYDDMTAKWIEVKEEDE
jgi:hypothetical protein